MFLWEKSKRIQGYECKNGEDDQFGNKTPIRFLCCSVQMYHTLTWLAPSEYKQRQIMWGSSISILESAWKVFLWACSRSNPLHYNPFTTSLQIESHYSVLVKPI